MFLRRLCEKLTCRSADAFCYYYSSCGLERVVTFADLGDLVAPKIALLENRISPGSVLFIINDDALDQISWWLSAVILRATPGILTPITAKLHKEKYFSELSAILKSYNDAYVLIGGNLSSDGQYSEAAKANRVLMFSKDDLDRHIRIGRDQWTEPEFGDVPLVFQQSSGTTGIRKGMFLTEQKIINQLENYNHAMELNDHDVIVSWLPLYHDMGLVACLLQAVYWCIPLVLTSPFVWLQSPNWLFQAIERHAGSLCYLPNFAFNLMTQRVGIEEFNPATLRSLRMLINCSEPIVASSVQKFIDKFESIGLSPGSISSSYAMAENTFAVTQSLPGRGVVIERIDKNRLENNQVAVLCESGTEVVSSGKVIDNVQVKIAIDGKDCADGEAGNIYIKSDCQIESYHGVGEEVSVLDKDGWLYTGDVGYLRQGELFVVGRRKDLIIRGGRNLNPVDIENVVGETEEIKAGRVVTFGFFNEDEGTEDVVVIAEFGGDRVSDLDQVKMRCIHAMTSSFDVTPQDLVVVRPNWLVKSSSGKISRSACKEKYINFKNKQKVDRLAVHEYSLMPEHLADHFAQFGRDSKIATPTLITSPGRIKIGNWVSLGTHGKILMQTDFSRVKTYAMQHFPEVRHDFDRAIYGKRDPFLKIGDCTMIGDYFFISCALWIEIGTHVVMSDRVFITDSNHLYENRELPIALQSNSLGTPVIIGDHSWIGINAVILEGVRIGKHAIVSANTVVTRDVPDYAVVAGNPARIVKIIGAETDTPICGAIGEESDEDANAEALIQRLVAKEFGAMVGVSESLFRSGVIDSLGALRLIEGIEQLFIVTIDGREFFEGKVDTIRDIARFVRQVKGD